MNSLIKPIVTEKTMAEQAGGWYAFEVNKTASKMQVKTAVEKQFGVRVLEVKTVTISSKAKRNPRSRRISAGKIVKKAIVKIPSDQKIDLFETEAAPTPEKKKS